MKAITIPQPYASLIIIGAKRFLTMDRATAYRGPVAIHARKAEIAPDTKAGLALWHSVVHAMGQGADWSLDATHRAVRFMESDGRCVYQDQFPHGAVLATARLAECWEVRHVEKYGAVLGIDRADKHDDKLIRGPANELLFGDWTPGRYAWELADVQPLPAPVPAKGRPGLWEWEVDGAP